MLNPALDDQQVFAKYYSFEPLHAISDSGIWRQVAVPSRLYFAPDASQPLQGKRVAIKDVVDIACLKTTLSSRDYAALYGPAKTHAEYVKKLLSLGAIIIGKTKTSTFACADEPTDQWIDFHCPTNPRGDHYQSPSGSSAGAAAAMAGYHWLDISVSADCEFESSTVLSTKILTSNSSW